MARNQTVLADAHATAVTELLARFVTHHPGSGWSDAVDAEAHRIFANWVGCAIGPSGHATVLAAAQTLQPAPQASLLGRKDKVLRLAHHRHQGHAAQPGRLLAPAEAGRGVYADGEWHCVPATHRPA